MLFKIQFILLVFIYYNFIIMAKSFTYVVIFFLHENNEYLIDPYVKFGDIIFYFFSITSFVGLIYILLTNDIK